MPNSVRPFLCAVLIVAFASCSDAAAPNQPTAPYTVEEAQNLWRSQNISSYSYLAAQACFCAFPTEPVRVEVVQNKVFRVLSLATGAEISTTGWYTVDELFDQILSTTQPPAQVEFDARLGYPRRIERCCMADDSGNIYTASTLGRLG